MIFVRTGIRTMGAGSEFEFVRERKAVIVKECNCCVGWAKREKDVDLRGESIYIVAVEVDSDALVLGGMDYIIRVIGKPHITSALVYGLDEHGADGNGYMYMCKSSLEILPGGPCIMEESCS